MTPRREPPSATDLSWAVHGPPIGVWTTALGTADVLLRDVLTLLPNGIGWLESRSALRGIERFPVQWKHVQPGMLELARLLPEDDPRAEPEWEPVLYGVADIENDVGGKCQILRNTHNDVFWVLAGPVKLLDAEA